MKNLKKILVAIPLVLVMVLSVVPVFADEVLDDYSAIVATSGVQKFNLRIPYDKYVTGEQDYARNYPVWLAYETSRSESNHELIPGVNPLDIQNGGYPVGYVTASTFAASPMQIAETFLNDFSDGAFVIPSTKINNVLWVNYTVKVPESYVKANFKARHDVKYVSVEDATYVPSIKAPNSTTELNEIRDKHAPSAYTNSGITFADLPADLSQLKDGFTVNAYYNGFVTTATVTFAEQTLYLDKEGKQVEQLPTDGSGKTVTVKSVATYQLVEPFKVTVPAGASTVVDTVETANYEAKAQICDAAGKGIVDINGNAVKAKVEDKGDTDPEKLVPATMKGLLIIMDDAYTSVTVNHHYLTAEGEVVQTTYEQTPKGIALTIPTVNPAWYKEIAPFKVDTTRTEVKTITNNKTLTMGQNFVNSYVVDLYYTAAEEVDQQAIDAAFTGTQAGVQNANNAATLPATGAASNAFALVASAVVAALGFLLKK